MMALHITVAAACAASALLVTFGYYLDLRAGRKITAGLHVFCGTVFVANAGLAVYHTVKAFEAAL